MFERQPSKAQIPATAKVVFQGQFYTVVQWPQRLYDGSVATFESVMRPDTVDIIAVTEDKKIVITRQEQPALKQFISLPGGMIDESEEVEAAARRELREETGYVAGELEAWYIHQPLDRVDWCCFVLVATDCRRVAEPTPDAGEKIQVELLTFEEFTKLAFDPNFRNKNVAYEMLRRRGDDLSWNGLKRELGIGGIYDSNS
ncbi:MAG: NUDIX hydrolase [Patescibacteria group bacterium]